MLKCEIDIKKIDLMCGLCKICAGKSKLFYPFEKDLSNSDDLVREIMNFIHSNTNCVCRKTEIDKNPDINVFDVNEKLICRVESKYLEGQAFMKSKSFVGLYPREALVIDEPKLLSYFSCKQKDREVGANIPIFVVWEFDRPCKNLGGIAVFQEIDVLHQIYNNNGKSRSYERKDSYTDYNSGQKLGITKKYHFSITECEPIDRLPEQIISLCGF